MKFKHTHRNLRSALAHLFHPRRSNNHRARILHPEGFVVLGLFALVCIGFIQMPANVTTQMGFVLGYASDIQVDQVIVETNKQRATAGLSVVTEEPALSRAARAKASDMFAQQYWAHTSPAGKEPWDFMREADYTYRRAGENLARDFMVTSDMVTAWMNSPTHRANIMNGGFSQIGVAVVNGTLEGVETTLVVQMFGTPIGTKAVASITDGSSTISLTEEQLPAESDVVAGEAKEIGAPISDLPVIGSPAEPEAVLAAQAVPTGFVSGRIIYSPLYLAKAAALAVALLLVTVLLYDGLVAYSANTVRFVGKNTAHLCLFLTVVFVLFFFKGGMIQ